VQFSEVIGQELIKSKLADGLNNKKVGHAQLLLGDLGFGGLPLALSFSQYILCKDRNKEDSCGKCSSCLRVLNLQHPDLHFVFPTVQSVSKTSTPLLSLWREQIKEFPYFDLNKWVEKIDPKGRKPIISVYESDEIIKRLSLHAYEGGYKVIIIWLPEEMNISSANKLLKILEEPPEKTLFLLICSDKERLLPTIVSRTQIIPIPRLTFEEIREYLISKGLNIASADSIAGKTEGNLIRAHEEGVNNNNQDDQRELFIQMMRACFKKDVIDMIGWAEEAASHGKDNQKRFLTYAIHMFRQSILKNYTEGELTMVSGEEEKFLANFSRFITGNNVQDFSTSFNDAVYHIDRNANAKILFTQLCFQVMRYIHNA